MIQNKISYGPLCVSIAFALTYICLSSSSADAQQVKSALAQNTELYFDHVKVGATECKPVVATNTATSTLIISNVTFTVGAEHFTITDTSLLPIVLKTGESATLGQVCFTAEAPNKEYVGYIAINYSALLNSNDGEIRVKATTELNSSLPCFTVVFDSTVFGPVFYGGQAIRTMSVTNNTDVTKTLRCIDITIDDAQEFTGFGKQFPLEIPAHEMRQIKLVFAPLAPKANGSDNFRSNVKLESMDETDGCSPDFDIYGIAIRPTDMNIFNPFNRTSALPALKMSGTDEIFGQTFLFQCTDKDSLRVDSIVLDNPDSHFILTPTGACSSLPMVATPGELLAVRISLRTNDPVVYNNRLRFVLGNGMPPIVYDVQAMRTIPLSGVGQHKQDESFSFSAIPNPSSGSIAIKVSEDVKADVDIFDAAGKKIISQKNIRAWTWNGQSKSGVSVPSGNYFIRAASHNANGKEIVRTKQVVISR